jgi:hypothetical protein
MNQYAQGNDTKNLALLGNLLYHQQLAALGGQRVDLQGGELERKKAADAVRASQGQQRLDLMRELPAIRARVKAQTAQNPDVVELRKLQIQLLKRKVNEAVLSPSQKADLAAAKFDMAHAESLFTQAMDNRNHVEDQIARHVIADDPITTADGRSVPQSVFEREQAYAKAEEARQILQQSQGRYNSLLGSLPQPPGAPAKPILPPVPGQQPNVLQGLFGILQGATGGGQAAPPPVPAATSQSTLPANPKAGKKTPPKPKATGDAVERLYQRTLRR